MHCMYPFSEGRSRPLESSIRFPSIVLFSRTITHQRLSLHWAHPTVVREHLSLFHAIYVSLLMLSLLATDFLAFRASTLVFLPKVETY